jgi:hypothetical protein
MSEPLVTQLLERLHEIAVAPQMKVVVIKGLPQVFSGGASRELLEDLVRGRIEILKHALSLGRRQVFEATRTVETFMHQICFAQTDIVRLIEENYGS